MLVVSDTSPISSMIQAGHVDLVSRLFGDVLIPPAVGIELLQFHATIPPFVRISEAVDEAKVAPLLDQLDLGEAEAMVLAAERRADFLLMDERRGRKLAAQSGIPVIGLLVCCCWRRNDHLLPRSALALPT